MGQKVEVGRGAMIQGATFGDIANVIVKPGAPDPPRPAAKPGTAAGWTTEQIRELLTAAFDDEELTALCFDHFRPVYEGLSTGMSTGQKVQRLLDYCERHVRTNELLQRVQERNPAQFARFQARLVTIEP